MIRQRNHIKFAALLLIPVYLLVLLSAVKNCHTHVLPNGLVITHSHPFADSKTGLPVEHSHTKNQILFYQLFTFDFFDIAPEVFLAVNYTTLLNEINCFNTDQISGTYIPVTLLRGPPAA